MKKAVCLLLTLALLAGFSALAELSLVKVDGGYYSLRLPSGWQYQVMGEYGSFSFRAWDPADPDCQIFYYGELSPFSKSEKARAWNEKWIALGGFSYQFSADAPAIDINDISTAFYMLGDYGSFYNKYAPYLGAPSYSFPVLKNLGISGVYSTDSLFSSVASSSGVAFGSLQGAQSGRDLYGVFSGSIVPLKPQIQDGLDVSWAVVYDATGVIAPQEKFAQLYDVLNEAVFSLTMPQSYINEGIRASENRAAALMADNAARQAMYDQCNAAWHQYFMG